MSKHRALAERAAHAALCRGIASPALDQYQPFCGPHSGGLRYRSATSVWLGASLNRAKLGSGSAPPIAFHQKEFRSYAVPWDSVMPASPRRPDPLSAEPPTAAELAHPTLAGYLRQPRSIVAGQLGASRLDRDGRKSAWAEYGVEASLTKLAELHATIDFATLNGTRRDVELAWLIDIPGDPANRARNQVGQGNTCFSARALVQCTKEAIEFGDNSSEVAVSDTDILRFVTSIHAEHDRPQRLPGLPEIHDVDATSMQQMGQYLTSQGQEFIDVERGEMMVDEVASASFERNESLVAALAATHDTWRRPWPSAPPSLDGISPADLFTTTFGVNFDDLLAAGLLITELAQRGTVVFTVDDLVRGGVFRKAAELVDTLMAIDLEKLRREVARERRRHVETQWLRYTFQRFPLIRLPDRRLLLVKAQFGIQRFFGGLLYWELWSKLGGPDSQPAEDFQRAMADVFEHRVGDVLKRIAATPAAGNTQVAHENELARTFMDNGNRPSVCDWTVASGRLIATIDANNRPLHQPFAERTGTVDEFRIDIGHNLIGDVPQSGTTKLSQLASTIGLLKAHDGLPGRFTATELTLYVPLVAVPDAGLPYTALVDYEVLSRARDVPGLQTSNVLPPAVVTLLELHLLHGIAEQYRKNPIEILALWRQTVAGSPLPMTLQDFLPAIGIAGRPMNGRLISLSQRVRKQLEQRLQR